MKKILLAVIILSSLLLTSCFSYRDINRVIFVTSLVVDIDEKGEYVLYVEAFHSYRSNQTNAEQGDRLFFQDKSISLYEAGRRFNHMAAYKVDYTQNKAIIITKEAAKKGVQPMMDILERNQELILRSHILILDVTPEELMKFEIKQNEYIGLYINELMDNPFLVKQHRLDRINQYLNHRVMKGRTHVLSILDLDENVISKNLIADEGAVIQDDKMVARLTEGDMKAYRILQDRLDRGLITVPHLYDEGKFMAVDTIMSKTKTDIEYDGEKILLKKKVSLRTTFGETQSPLIFTEENIDKIEDLVATVVKDNCEDLFQRMKEQELDIFEIAEMMERKYPNVELEDPLAITKLQLEIEHQLEGSPNVTNFR